MSLGCDLSCYFDLIRIDARLTFYYGRAVREGIVTPVQNDIILADFSDIAPLWEVVGPGGGKMNYNNGHTNGGTHQLIAARAFDYVRSRFPNVFPAGNGTTLVPRGAFVSYSDWPDVPESGERVPYIAFGLWSNNRRFYNPTNRQNFFRNTIEPNRNARERVNYFYQRALAVYRNDRIQAFRYLGAASHFLSDLAAPVHTGDQISPSLLGIPIGALFFWWFVGDMATILYNHSRFESVATTRAAAALAARRVQPNTLNFLNMTPFNIAGQLAAYSYQNYRWVGGPYIWFTDHNREVIADWMLPRAADANAAMLIRFARDLGYSEINHVHFHNREPGSQRQQLETRQVNLQQGRAQYFRFTTSVTREFTIQGLGNLDTMIAVYRGSIAPGNRVNNVSHDDFRGFSSNAATNRAFFAGNTYFIRVWIWGYRAGSYTLLFMPGYNRYPSLSSHTGVMGITAFIGAQGHVRAYSFRPTETGRHEIFTHNSIHGGAFVDSVLYVFNMNTGQSIFNDGGNSHDARIEMIMQAGGRYMVVVAEAWPTPTSMTSRQFSLTARRMPDIETIHFRDNKGMPRFYEIRPAAVAQGGAILPWKQLDR